MDWYISISSIATVRSMVVCCAFSLQAHFADAPTDIEIARNVSSKCGDRQRETERERERENWD